MTLPIVALVPRHATSWVKFFDISNAIRADGRFKPVIVLATPEMATRAIDCERAGVAYHDLSGTLAVAIQLSGSWWQAVGAWLDGLADRYERLGNSLFLSWPRIGAMRRRLRAEYDIFSKFFAEIKPVAVFVPGDRELSPVPAVLKAAGDAGIPRLNAAFGVPAAIGVLHQRRNQIRFRVDRGAKPMLLNRWVARRWPSQVKRDGRASYLFSPGWLLLALHSEGMMSANPWVQGGGHSDRLLQNSKPRVDEFVKLGVPEGKIDLTGDPALDRLYRAWTRRSEIRGTLKARYQLSNVDAFVMMAVPNDPEHGLGTFAEHHDRLDVYFGCLAHAGVNCLLSLHPKSEPSNYQDLAAKWGHVIVDEALADCLPAVDLFICSASSTILWAQLVGIPTLNLNYRALRDPDYLDVPGVIDIVTESDLSAALKMWRAAGLLNDAFAEYAAQLRSNSLFDGSAGRRICDLVAELSSPQSKKASLQ